MYASHLIWIYSKLSEINKYLNCFGQVILLIIDYSLKITSSHPGNTSYLIDIEV